MPLIPRRPPRRGRFYSGRRYLTAAADPVAAATGGSGGVQRLYQPWQKRAFGYYDLLGECWNPAQFYARGMAKIRFFPATRQPDGSLVEIEDGPAVAALREVEHVAAEYGRLLFLIGEGRLCQSLPKDAEPGDRVLWEFLSPTEVAVSSDGRLIFRGGDGTPQDEYLNISGEEGEPQPGEMRMWRMWRKHPQNSRRADSPIRAVLDLYEQLWWLTMGERSDIQNRIADSGLLLIPAEIDFGPETPEDEAAADDPENDPFAVRVGEMMMAAIGEPGSASASVPGVIRAPADLLHPDKFRILHTHEASDSIYTSQREAAIIERIALGLDMPNAAVTGIGSLNHWNAWKNEDEKWQHLEPVAAMFAHDLTRAYLRPSLDGDADEIEVGYDNSEFTRDPDRGPTAINLNKQGLLSGEETLVANGWTETARMPDDEHQEWLAIQLRAADLLTGDPDGGEEPPTREAEEDADTAQTRAEDFAFARARAVGGAYLRTMRRGCPECFDGTDGVTNEDLLTVMRDRVGSIQAWDARKAAVGMARAYVDTLRRLGYEAYAGEAAAWFVRHVHESERPRIRVTAE